MKLSTIRKLPQPISDLVLSPTPPLQPAAELTPFQNRIVSLERKSYSPDPPLPTAPPVQKVGDAWVAASVLAPTTLRSKGGVERAASTEGLRDSVQRMFDQPSAPIQEPLPLDNQGSEESNPMQRVMAWQQPDATTQHLSIFRLARGTIPPTEIGEPIAKTDTLLGFDPNDLNPSRSASQVRRQTSVLGGVEGLRRRYEPKADLSGIEEGSDSLSADQHKPPTHISHVTFPKPTMGGHRIGHQPMTPHLEAAEGSTVDDTTHRSRSTTTGADSLDIRTPQTQGSEATFQSSLDPTVLAKLEDHSAEHGRLQGDLQKVIGTLTTLVAGAGVTGTIEGKLDNVALDVKAIENALNLNALSIKAPPSLTAEEETGDGKVPEVHRKLDAIAKLCEDLLARGVGGAVLATAPVAKDGSRMSPPLAAPPMVRKGSLGIAVDATEEKEAGEEVAAIMTDLVSLS
jgi:hypothetical protein